MCLLAWHDLFENAAYILIFCKDVVTMIPKECVILGNCFDVTFFRNGIIPAKYVKNANVTQPEVYIPIFLPRGTQFNLARCGSV